MADPSMSWARRLLPVVVAGGALAGCGEAPGGTDWLHGTADERFEAVARQFGGFDQTMIEVSYRYGELYRAGRTENWEYAAYQLEEMEEALQRGLERRPARAESARPFLERSLPEMLEAAEARDAAAFEERFAAFSSACRACHVAEGVPFIPVEPREHPVQPPPAR